MTCPKNAKQLMELETEARERLQQIRLHLAAALDVFNPQTQRMIVKCDIYNFELCVETPTADSEPESRNENDLS
jgi:hypothetical protein